MQSEAQAHRQVLSVIGVPSSAASYAAGQDRAPSALREAGLMDALLWAGVTAEDCGDLPEQIWAPDRTSPRAQNVSQVVESVVALVDRVHGELARGHRVLVVGGNCTIAVGALAGLQRFTSLQCGVLYVDRHFDMNTPNTTREGALDWMGLGHAVNLPGALPSLAGAFGTPPLLGPRRISFLGVAPEEETTQFERMHVARLNLKVTPQSVLIDNPELAARSALEGLPQEPFVSHLDVDVLDFTDVPLAENTSGRNSGPSLSLLQDAMSVVVADSRWRVLTIGEINPTRADGIPQTLHRFNDFVAQTIASNRSASA